VLGKQYLATSTSTLSGIVEPVENMTIGWGVGRGLLLRRNSPGDEGQHGRTGLSCNGYPYSHLIIWTPGSKVDQCSSGVIPNRPTFLSDGP